MLRYVRLASVLVFALSAACGSVEVSSRLAGIDVARYQGVLAESFDDGETYRFAECQGNARRLLGRFEERGLATGELEVVVLLHELRRIAGGPTMPVRLVPQRPRRQPSSGPLVWEHHVLVTGDDHVFDLDYAPRAEPERAYARAMFDRPGEDDVADRIVVRAVPAADYAGLYDAHGFAGVMRWLKDSPEADAAYPKRRLADLLD